MNLFGKLVLYMKSKHQVRNGIIVLVSGNLILAVLKPQVFVWIWSVIKRCWSIIASIYSAPGWIFIILCLMAFAAVVMGLMLLYVAILSDKNRYITDTIEGTVWCWNWSRGIITNLWCYCSKCDCELVHLIPYRPYRAVEINKTDFFCENCDRVVLTIEGGNKSYALEKVKREIRRRMRIKQRENS